MRPFQSIVLLSILLPGCGGGAGGVSKATIERMCEVTCDKFDECSVPGGSGEGCVDTCLSQSGVDADGNVADSCDATTAEANACIDAYDNATCDELEAGTFPEECDICDAESTDDTESTVDTDPTNAGTNGGAGGGSACDDLQDCCDQIADTTVKASCEATVASGLDIACGPALTGYQASSLCQ